MNTIRTLVTGVTVVAAAAGATAVLSTTGSASAGTARSSTRSFTLVAHHGSDANIDLGRAGFSPGDEDLLVAPLTRGGKSVGRLVGNCTNVRVAKTADQLCEFVFHLGGGQITASGTVRSGSSGPRDFVLPILGGTGRYVDAGGQISVTPSSRSNLPIQVSLR
jgi:hypothetical protein